MRKRATGSAPETSSQPIEGSGLSGSHRGASAQGRGRHGRHSALNSGGTPGTAPASAPSARGCGGCAKIAGAALILLVLIAIAGVAIGRQLLLKPEVEVAAGQPVHVSVASGATTAEIGEQLAGLGVIDSALMFRYKARDLGVDGDLKPGEYDLSTGMPYEMVLDALTEGPPILTIDVTIPEGFTARQVAERFAAQAGVPADQMLALVTSGASQFAVGRPYLTRAHNGSLEGFLFPATYTVKPGVTAPEVVEMMLEHFDSQVATLDTSFAQSRGMELYDVVTIASILEREAQLPEEFPLVSSVIYNRLAKPMRLQLCATVLYTMPPGTTSLTTDDLDEDSPYNTYIHDGLPVGPISNPGLAALQAAANPADTGYYYYVLTGADGSQTFTRTYDEFLAAKASSEVRGN